MKHVTVRCVFVSSIAMIIFLANFLFAQKTYYIDSQNGDDTRDGLSESTAWKSHTMVSTVVFQPGDTIAFKKGSQFSGPIQITQSGDEHHPIVFTSYGEGERPRFTNPNDQDMNGNCFRISGSWIVVENLFFHDTPPTQNVNRLKSIFLLGAIFNMSGADHNIIRNNVFMKCTKAIQSTGEYTLITRNFLDGPNHALWNGPGSGGGWGPMGIQLGIGNQEVCYNTIKNYLTTDSDYGSDGGAIELDDGRYHKDNFYIHHNYTEGNAGFIESSWGADYNPYVQEVHNLRVAFNVNFDGQDWLYMWAPCHDCFFDNNTVIRTDDFTSPLNDGAYLDFGGIHFRNNLFVYTRDAYQGPGARGSVTENNWYFNINNRSQVHWDPNQAGSGDPFLVDLEGGDYHLKTESPLRGKATNLHEYYSVDFEGNPLPDTGAWDIGVFQFNGSVAIASPEIGQVFFVPADVSIQADVTCRFGNIAKVEFYTDSTKLGEDDTSPYSTTWNVAQCGVYHIKAVATQANGAVITSNSLWILVTDSSEDKERVWHSYDVVTNSGSQPLIVPDQEGTVPTVVELGLSSKPDSAGKGDLFQIFNSGPHSESFNHVEDFWANGGQNAYPYAGRSTVDRGSDTGESNTPEPIGVRDLQLHPPESDLLTTASFMIPLDGTYTISDLAVRRVHNEGSKATYSVFNQKQELLVRMDATNDRAWVRTDSIFSLGPLAAGDWITFAVGRGENDHFYWDATEIAWTVMRESNNGVDVDEGAVPPKYHLNQNFPNPFNSNTAISFQLSNDETVGLCIYDIRGSKRKTLIDGEMPSGNHTIEWEGTDDSGKPIASGIYICKLETKSYSKTIKLILIH